MKNLIPFAGWMRTFAMLLLVSSISVGAANTPGKIGVYCNFPEVSRSPAELSKTMEQIKAAGIDFILPYVKLTSGNVKWESKLAAPGSVEHPEFMKNVLESAHRAGLKVYPVVCVATEGGEGKPNLWLQRNPSWAFMVDGERMGFIDPGNAAARKYETDLIAELVGKYDVDGLSLDYMRAPNRVGYTDSARDFFLSRSNVDLALVVKGKEKTSLGTEGGKTSLTNNADEMARNNPIWPAWKAWRREQLNGFMHELRAAVEKAKPGLPISTYCWGAHTYTGSFETCQDWKTWIAEGSLQWINPSGYRYTEDSFRQAAELNRKNIPKGFPYYITIGVSTSHGKLPDVAAIKRQMEISKESGADGLVFFTWEALSKFLPEAGKEIKAW